MTTLQHGPRVAIRVLGTPVPQGSKTVVPARGKRRASLRDANSQTLEPWRNRVKDAAEDATRYADTLTGPVRVWIRFTFDRPRSHYLKGRATSHLLTSNAPTFPGYSCGDVDKLQRACFDALTDAGVWRDDTQVVDVRARKFYAGEDELALPRAGVDIIVEELS